MISNVVIQGGVLSPFLFILYTDELLIKINILSLVVIYILVIYLEWHLDMQMMQHFSL